MAICAKSNAVMQFIENDSGEFPVLKPIVEASEPPEFLHHCLWYSPAATRRADVEMTGQEAEHPLLLKAPFESANCFRMVDLRRRPKNRWQKTLKMDKEILDVEGAAEVLGSRKPPL
jgi:hypothetical protein